MKKSLWKILLLLAVVALLVSVVLVVTACNQEPWYGIYYAGNVSVLGKQSMTPTVEIKRNTVVMADSGGSTELSYTISGTTLSLENGVTAHVVEDYNVFYMDICKIASNFPARNGRVELSGWRPSIPTILSNSILSINLDSNGTFTWHEIKLDSSGVLIQGTYTLNSGVLVFKLTSAYAFGGGSTQPVNIKGQIFVYISNSYNVYSNIHIRDYTKFLTPSTTTEETDKTLSKECIITHRNLSWWGTCQYCNKTVYLQIDDAVLMYDQSDKYHIMQAEFYGEVADSRFDFLYPYIQTVFIGNKVKEIASGAFEGFANLTKIIFEDNSQCALVGGSAFRNCISLTKVELPDSVTSIESYAFASCKLLSDIYVPDSVYKMGEYVMFETAWENKQPSNGLIYLGNVAYKYKGTMQKNTVITLREGTIGIAGKCFIGEGSLIEVRGYEKLRSIGDYAFSECKNLQNLPIYNRLETIGYRCFWGCPIENVVLPPSITKIGHQAFMSCKTIRNIFTYKGLVSTGLGEFVYNPSLSSWAEIDWRDIGIYDECPIYIYSETEPPLNEEQTDYDGNYWHYDSDGNITIWKKAN